MHTTLTPDQNLAAAITKDASRQTYYTIRYLVDRQRVNAAYNAYAYFRWVDDTIDAIPTSSGAAPSDRTAFLQRQQRLLAQASLGRPAGDVSREEALLIALIHSDNDKHSGLHSYLIHMMAVMAFDATRRGRLITQSELNEYTRSLATAVTEAMHYFIGHDTYAPHTQARYLAVTAAHITHMLRDTCDDLQAGYFNIPREVLEAQHITPQDVHSQAYRAWVQSRVYLARLCFKAGKVYLSQLQNLRCRLAGFAYMARFEKLLDTIEHEDYYLRPQYNERPSLSSRISLVTSVLSTLVQQPGPGIVPQTPSISDKYTLNR